MFRQLIEAIRTESSQRGGSKERVRDQGIPAGGPMVGGKEGWKRAANTERRRAGKRVAAQADDTGTPFKPGRKVPTHPRKVYQYPSGMVYPRNATRRQRGHSK